MRQELRKSCWNLCDDANKDDQRNTVTDTARCDLFTQPHQEHTTTNNGDYGRSLKERTRISSQTTCLKTDRQTIGLCGRQNDGEVTRVLVQLTPTLFAFFLQLFEWVPHGTQKLHHDGCRDVWHNTKGKDRHPRQRTAGEHRQDTADARLGVFHELLQRDAVDARNGNKRTKAVNDQQTKRK